jgi:hypothetical protein
MSENLQEIFLREISLLLLPLAAATDSDVRGQLLLDMTGWDLAAGSDTAIHDRLVELIDAYERLDDLIENPPETLADVLEAVDGVSQLFSAAREVPAQAGTEAQGLEELGSDLIKALVIGYLKYWHPAVYDVLALLTVIRPPADISLERINDLLTDPLEVLSAEYLKPQGLVTAQDAKAVADKLFPRLAALLTDLGFQAVYGVKPESGPNLGVVGDQLAEGMLTVFLQPDFEVENRYGVTLALSPRDLGDLGLVVLPFGEVLPYWDAGVDLTAAVGFAIGPQGLTFFGASDTTGVSVSPSVLELPGALIGSMTGSRLEIGQFQISGEVNLNTSGQEYGLLLDMGSSALVISPGDGDGFLKKILPSEGMRIDFDLAIGWSNKKGFYFRGSAGLETVLPVGVSLFGVLTVNSIYLAIKTDGSDIRTAVAASIGTQIGPVNALVDQVGLEATFAFPEDGGNLGIFDLNLGFKFPTAIGLSVDAGSITGGGFVRIDPPNYAGVLELSFQDQIDLTAFGLITTKLPDGKPGFSFVISILAEFQPIQIGLGFALAGVGGLIGINRQFNEEALKQAFKTHSLDAILFPQSPIKDAVKLIESIQSILPAREGYHVLGPMAKLIWGGTLPLVNFEIGIFIQLGGPLKIVLIGQAWSRLPKEDAAQLVINVDVLGIIDFGEERLAFDAMLFDSRILDIHLDGQMALRADWSQGEENFALSVGGFHPQFKEIPAGFPPLRRLAMVMGENPRLSLTMYLAITTNTLQVGAKLELWAKKLGFTITGGASFDALFTFSPFSFLVTIKVWVNVKRGWIDLGLWLELELTGPNPIIAAGYVKIKLGWFFSVKVRFRAEFGQKIPEPLPEVSPLAALKTELQHPRAIRAHLPAWASASLAFTETAEKKIDPIADLLILQQAVPLNFLLEKFGGGIPAAAERRLRFTTGVGDEQPAQSLFAPEQFKNWTVEERLSAKPFEKYDAGISFRGAYVLPEAHKEERQIVFETVLRESKEYLDSLPGKDYRKTKIRTACLWQPEVSETVLLQGWSQFGAGSYYQPRRVTRDESNPNYVKVMEPAYEIAGSQMNDGKTGATATEANLTFAAALDVARNNKDATIVIRNRAHIEAGYQKGG